jgi:hypothetical protein
VTFLERVPPGPVADLVEHAVGRSHRVDPSLPGTGGPAGNAVLTAWTGLVLLVLSLGELLTLVDVRGLVSWHVAIGALLVPPALMKTGSTGWRLVRYYSGSRPYREAGPPPLVLRLLGPLVVASTLGLLASGVWLVVHGEQSARQALVDVGGLRIDWITIHQGFFAVWCVVTGLHLLGRILPALRLSVARAGTARPAGAWARAALMVVAAVVAVGLAVVLVRADASWAHDQFHRFDHLPPLH